VQAMGNRTSTEGDDEVRVIANFIEAFFPSLERLRMKSNKNFMSFTCHGLEFFHSWLKCEWGCCGTRAALILADGKEWYDNKRLWWRTIFLDSFPSSL